MKRRNADMRTNVKTAKGHDHVRLDPELRGFMRECMSCQSPGIAAWATRIMRQGWLTMQDLERALALGFLS